MKDSERRKLWAHMMGRVRALAQMNGSVSAGLQSLAMLAGKLEQGVISLHASRNGSRNPVTKPLLQAETSYTGVRARTPAKVEPRVSLTPGSASPRMLAELQARARAARTRI